MIVFMLVVMMVFMGVRPAAMCFAVGVSHASPFALDSW